MAPLERLENFTKSNTTEKTPKYAVLMLLYPKGSNHLYIVQKFYGGYIPCKLPGGKYMR
jgi:hypothetical protein